jgi:hypothetical protein
LDAVFPFRHVEVDQQPHFLPADFRIRQQRRREGPSNAFDGLLFQEPFKFRSWARKCSYVDQGHPDLPFRRDLDGTTAKTVGSNS